MAFKEVGNLDADTTISLGGISKKTGKPNPKSIEGYFIGSKQTETGKLHIIQTSKGNVGVWGKTDLDKKLLNVTAGLMVRLTHTGMLKVPGKNDMYKYKVEVDESNVNESISAPAPSHEELSVSEDEFVSPEYMEEEDDAFADDSALDEVVVARPSVARTPATTPSAAAQAKIREQLARRK